MSFETQPDFASQVADLNKYGQALNNCETVEEVVSLSLEAVSLLFEFQSTTFVEARDDQLRVAHSTYTAVSPGDEPGPVVREAFERQETVVATGDQLGDGGDAEAMLAIPATIVDDVVAIMTIRATRETEFGDAVIRPLEILASHAATAIGNIRSRERLERARQDLAKRKEMIELYDRLLRHDLGNDLQVIAAFSEELADTLEDDEADYAERIHRSARGAADLIERVGNLVNTLEEQDEPTPRALAEVLATVVGDARDQYESLTVEFDADSLDYRVYGGDLLDSVFTNIVTNAAVHTEGAVTVHLSVVEAEPDRLTVSIADDGSGIPEEIADELFEMGAKGPDSDGTGFGLGFVKALTESYGGDIRVGNSDAGGADFRITLDRV